MYARFRHYCLWLQVCPRYYVARKYSNLDRSLYTMLARLRKFY